MFVPMRDLTVKLLSERGHWRVEVYVDGEVEPRTIFGCRAGFEPILRCLLTAEAQVTAVSAGSKLDPTRSVPSITVAMPSGRRLSFRFVGGQEGIPDAPEPI